jgi:hypothetical protein
MSQAWDDFLSSLDMDNLRVIPPDDLIFLCGGPIADVSDGASSVRDSFIRYVWNEKSKVADKFRTAEEITDWFHEEGYSDLILFERHIAQLSTVVILFLEGPGAIAELGVFSQIDEIAEKLLVFVRELHYENTSFIRLGPIKYLESKYPGRIHVYPWDVVTSLVADRPVLATVDAINPDMLEDLEGVLEEHKKTEKFNCSNDGHRMMLIADLIEYMHALKFEEIVEVLKRFGIHEGHKTVSQYLFLLSKLGFVLLVARGHDRYYVSASGARLMNYAFKPEAEERNRDGIRARIFEHYKEHDERRFKALKKRPNVPAKVDLP